MLKCVTARRVNASDLSGAEVLALSFVGRSSGDSLTAGGVAHPLGGNNVSSSKSYQLEVVQYGCASTGSGTRLNRVTMGYRADGFYKVRLGERQRNHIL